MIMENYEFNMKLMNGVPTMSIMKNGMLCRNCRTTAQGLSPLLWKPSKCTMATAAEYFSAAKPPGSLKSYMRRGRGGVTRKAPNMRAFMFHCVVPALGRVLC